MDAKTEAAYEHLVDGAIRYFEIGAPLDAAELTRQAANLAWGQSDSRYYDERLENLLAMIGSQLHLSPQLPKSYIKDPQRLNVWHVSTRLFETFGHTKLLENWVRFDTASKHSVVLTSQGEERYPIVLREAIERQQGAWIEFEDSLNILEKAAELRELTKFGADLVLLHHFPDDPVPSIAYSCDYGPPVLLVDHADHVFWLGCAAVDAAVHIRAVAKDFSMRKRDLPRSFILPIPIETPEQSSELRHAAREQLCLEPESVVLLAMAAKYKFRPNAYCDFFRSVYQVLERHSNAHCYVLGVTRGDLAEMSPEHLHPRLHLEGVVAKAGVYKYAADIGLLSYPIGSLTSALEIGAHGVPLVPPYYENSEMLLGIPDAIENIVRSPTSEQAWLEQVSELVANPTHRLQLGAITRDKILAHQDQNSWRARLEEVYLAARSIRHHSRTLESPASRILGPVAK